MTQQLFFFKNIIMGIKKTQNFMLISNSFKTVHFQTFYKKFKVISLPISIILHLIPIKFETLKPPFVHYVIHPV